MCRVKYIGVGGVGKGRVGSKFCSMQMTLKLLCESFDRSARP